jgi:hypothetical protein
MLEQTEAVEALPEKPQVWTAVEVTAVEARRRVWSNESDSLKSKSTGAEWRERKLQRA